MQNNIQNLITETADNLKEFASGNLDFSGAAAAYRKLNSRYKEIISGKTITGNELNGIEGICYYHNVENFSIFTGIYKMSRNDFYSLAQFSAQNSASNGTSYDTLYDDESLNDKIINSNLITLDNIIDNEILKMPSNEEKKILHNIYIYPLITAKQEKIFLLSLSSSSYFSEDKFLFCGRLLKNIFNPIMNDNDIFNKNYFLNITDQVESFIKNNSNYTLNAFIFVFNSIDRIFGHTGTHSLFEISDEISNTLKKNYKQNAVFFALSLKDYLVLERKKKDDNQGKSKPVKPEFTYRGLNLPYQTLKFNINNDEPVYTLWDKISVFENYLRIGDIMKQE
jgi:hypothetical protein